MPEELKTGHVTRAEAAAALGVAPARINRWVQDGAPVAVRGSRGHSAMYDLDALKAWRDARARPDEPDVGLSLGEARARLACAQAEKWERENLRRRGELVEREHAVYEGRTAIAAAKTKLLQVPRQCVLRGVPREAEVTIRQCIVEALRELARWKSIEDAEAVLEQAEAAS